MAELLALRDINDDLNAAGATLVALTPQLPAHSESMIEKHKLPFDLLHDAGSQYAAQLGLRFTFPADLIGIYQAFGLDLPATNGTAGGTGDSADAAEEGLVDGPIDAGQWVMPMPARLVIDATGIVRAADIDPDYTRRPEPAKTLADVRAL